MPGLSCNDVTYRKFPDYPGRPRLSPPLLLGRCINGGKIRVKATTTRKQEGN